MVIDYQGGRLWKVILIKTGTLRGRTVEDYGKNMIFGAEPGNAAVKEALPAGDFRALPGTGAAEMNGLPPAGEPFTEGTLGTQTVGIRIFMAEDEKGFMVPEALKYPINRTGGALSGNQNRVSSGLASAAGN